MAEIETKLNNSLTGAYTHTITATDVTDGYVTIDFNVSMPLAGIVQGTTISGVISDLSTSILTYPANGKIKIEPSGGGVAEIFTITTVADVASSLDGTYFVVQDDAGSVGFWIDVGNTGTSAPTTGATRDVEITTVTAGMTADAVAGVLATAVNADADFTAPAAVANVVTVTSANVQALLDPADGDTGFTFAVTTQGVTAESEGNFSLEVGNKLTFLAFRDSQPR